MKYALLLTMFAVWILTSCSPTPVSPQATARPSPSATIEPEAQMWDGMKIPVECRFSSISPNFDWILYSCKDKLWLAKARDAVNATLVIQDDGLTRTSWSSDGERFVVGSQHRDQENNYVASLWLSKRDTPTEKKLLYQGRSYCDRQFWSPSGELILAVGGSGKNSDAILIRTDGTGLEPLPPLVIMNWWHGASWSPDSTHLAYASDYFLEVKDLNVETGVSTLVYTQTGDIFIPAWSPDGKMIATLKESFPDNLVIVDSASKRVLNIITFPSDWKQSTDLFWSPDSKRIAIQFYRDGHQIGIVSLPSGEISEQPVEDLGWVLGWTKDGKSLVARSYEGDQEIIQAVPVE
ncbi:MAG: WD40 repeat domain-containing protein [Anaerolinea sp.]|nr:WD40 repeat domain-containing protein [Anaerolinea sp.]